jgi:uncharacterized protein
MVERIAEATKRPVKSMSGDRAFLKSLNPRQFADDRFGILTVTDILAELEKPGRDPRPEFKTAKFKEGVEKMADLRPGMALEGVVTNVTAFGAFVDVGVHQDGLVHVSELADRFVKAPREVVKAGDIVKVRVKEVDAARKRIALTMKSSTIDSSNVSTDAGTGSGRLVAAPVTSQRSFSPRRCRSRSARVQGKKRSRRGRSRAPRTSRSIPMRGFPTSCSSGSTAPRTGFRRTRGK